MASSATGRPSGDMPDPKYNPTLAGIIAAAGGTIIVGNGGFPIVRDGVIEARVAWLVARFSRMRTAREPGSSTSDRDPADIVVNLHHAYGRPVLRERHHASFNTGPS